MADELEINNIRVYLNGDRVDDADEGGGKIRDVVPGDEIKFRVEVENTFEEDIEIKDIEVRVTIENIDDGNDVSETSNEFDLAANETEQKTETVTVPQNAKTGTYKIIVEAYGEDEDDDDQEESVDFDLYVKGIDHEVKFTEFSITPSILTCGGSGTIIARLKNNGGYSESVILSFQSDKLGIASTTNVLLQSGQETIKTIPFSVPSVQAGNYEINARASYTGAIEIEKVIAAVTGNCKEKETNITTTGMAPVPIAKMRSTSTEEVLITTAVAVAVLAFGLIIAAVVIRKR